MPKTSNATAQACAKVEVQPGCTGSWTDIGGEATIATLPKEVVQTGVAYVFNSDTGVITSGKKTPVTVTIGTLFTNGVTEAFNLVRAVWQTEGCDKVLCVRITPEGGSIGDLEINIGDHNTNALLTGFKPPDVDASSGDPALAEFDVYGNYEYDVKAS